MLYNVLQKIKEAKIAVIGDIMLDRYIIGTVNRISPEAPVPVVHVKEETNTLGGAGNVVANLCKLKVEEAHIFCRIADDIHGSVIKTKLGGLHYNYGNSKTTYFGNEQTIVKTRIMAENHQIVRFDREHITPLPEVTANKLVEELGDGEYDTIVISDYGKGMITTYLLQRVYELAGRKIPICIDPSPKTYYPPMPEAIILPNTKERRELGKGIESKFKAVVETAGADGIYIRQNGELVNQIQAIKISDVVDTVGAGDTVTAVFAAAQTTGANIYLSTSLANVAASIVVRHAMTYAVSYEELATTVTELKL